MYRIIFFSSHIGLGHVTRDLQIYRSLKESLGDDVRIDFCTAYPAYNYLRIKGIKVLEVCKNLFSMTPIAEEYIERKFYLHPSIARDYLNILKRNFSIIKEGIDLNKYDLIFADEFWEFVLNNDESIYRKLVFATDFIFKDYGLNPLENIISFILNKFYISVYPSFKERIFIGLLNEIPYQKTLFFYGDSMRKWVKNYFKIAGKIPSVPGKYRYITKEYARNILNIGYNKTVITVILGGSRTRNHILLNKILKSWIVFRRRHPNSKLYLILGPRGFVEHINSKDIKILNMVGEVGPYLKASDIVISRAGKTTVTDIEYLGIPSILIPIKDHFEQKWIARNVRNKDFIEVIKENDPVEKYVVTMDKLLEVEAKPENEALFKGAEITAYHIMRNL